MHARAYNIGLLHDDVILLQLPESLSLLFSCTNYGTEMNSGSCSQILSYWSLTTFKGKISVFIVVFKFVMHFCYRRTIRLNQENYFAITRQITANVRK